MTKGLSSEVMVFARRMQDKLDAQRGPEDADWLLDRMFEQLCEIRDARLAGRPVRTAAAEMAVSGMLLAESGSPSSMPPGT